MKNLKCKHLIDVNSCKQLISLLALLVGVSGCFPITPDMALLLVASPTPRSCSLEEIASRSVSTQTASTQPPLDTTGIKWSLYTDSRYDYSFEYPAVYDDPSNRECALSVINPVMRDGQEVYIGSGAGMFIKQIQHASWRDDACLIALDQSQNSQLTMLNETTFADEDSLDVAFTRTGNPNGRIIMFQHNDLFYIIEKIPNSKCDIEGTTIESSVVFQHMVDSFRFQP
ncbi:MAG: hypothetical protein AB9891_09950 [Anaerolineaceae bacterium]